MSQSAYIDKILDQIEVRHRQRTAKEEIDWRRLHELDGKLIVLKRLIRQNELSQPGPLPNPVFPPCQDSGCP